MERTVIESLKTWKDSPDRKPLILQGARQVGKTWLMKEFGRQCYKNTAYFQFDNNPGLAEIFNIDYKIYRIIEALEIKSGHKIKPGDTLIIFDEIQECPKALTSLKYFCENAPEYHIVAAGSLLGLSQHGGTGFPVGKTDFLKIYPLDFIEFIKATDRPQLAEAICKKDFELLRPFEDELERLLKTYLYVGGMPEVVRDFAKNRDYKKTRKIQKAILYAYENDFSKHIPANTAEKTRMLWQSIPLQLARENKKFLYSAIRTGARAKEYEIALNWLSDAGLVYKISRTKKPSMPLMAYQDFEAFKLFVLDVGLLAAMTSLDAKAILEKNRIFEEFKGALSEQYVCQQFKSSCPDMPLYYWTDSTSRSEIDFIAQISNMIVPVEVKASINLKAKSLHNFIRNNNTLKAVRTSLAQFKINDGGILYDIPLWAIDGMEEIVFQ